MNILLVPASIVILLAQATAPQLLNAVPPIPPLNALFGSIVILNLTIDADGNVLRTSVLTGTSAFAEASLDVVKRWKFTAVHDSNRPRSVSATFLYRARL